MEMFIFIYVCCDNPIDFKTSTRDFVTISYNFESITTEYSLPGSQTKL